MCFKLEDLFYHWAPDIPFTQTRCSHWCPYMLRPTRRAYFHLSLAEEAFSSLLTRCLWTCPTSLLCFACSPTLFLSFTSAKNFWNISSCAHTKGQADYMKYIGLQKRHHEIKLCAHLSVLGIVSQSYCPFSDHLQIFLFILPRNLIASQILILLLFLEKKNSVLLF